MNSMKGIQNPFTYRIPVTKLAIKELQSTKFYAILLVSVMVVGIFSFSPAISSLMNDVVIRSTGRITTISPLHVDGRYIKDAFGNIVYLRGVNKVEFCDDPDGTWMGSTMWTDGNVKAELDAMKSWGINTIRCHLAVENWKYDLGPDAHSAISHRDAVKRLLTFAAERDMYVILDGYGLRDYWHGAQQDPMPFPPYQKTEGAEEVIANVDEYVDWIASMADELKEYPNVIFELWNEPVESAGISREDAYEDWLTACQLAINAIRATGATHLIIFQWGTSVYCNLYEDTEAYGYTLHDWIEHAIESLNDPTGNLVYSTHIYRSYGSAGLYVTADMRAKWNSQFPWDYNEIKRAFEFIGLKWVGNTLNKPLLIGEVGATLGWEASNPAEHQNELIGWNNILSLFNEWGLVYQAFWWRNTGVFRLLKHGEPWIPPPSTGGEILVNALKSQE